jgi:hypothetical protein
MAKDILSEYGRDTSQPQLIPSRSGGCMPGDAKDVMGYQPPIGPKGINDPKAPGIHGVNSGNTNQPSFLSSGGRPGLAGGINHGCCGSQGKY